MILDELLKLVDFELFKKESLLSFKTIVDEAMYSELQAFYERLGKISISILSRPEKLLLSKTALVGLSLEPVPHALDQLISASLQLKGSFGQVIFYMIFSAFNEKRPLNQIVDFCSLIEELNESLDFSLILKHDASITENLAILKAMHREKFTAKYPERTLQDLMSEFRRIDHNVRFPLEEEELEELLREYADLAKDRFNLALLTQAELKEKMLHHADLLKKEPHLRDARINLLACIREMVRREFNIFPHDTQMLAVLAIINNPESLKGRIAQVKTGEGKSTIIAILAAFESLQGQFVDIISSNQYLAARDRIKYQKFFESFDISVSDICRSNPQKEDFRGQVLYATSTDIKFSILRDALYNRGLRFSLREGKLEKRSQEVIIIDEVDNLLVDARGAARMAVKSNEDNRWVYEPILEFAKAAGYPSDGEIARLKDKLIHSYGGRYVSEVESFSEQRLSKWLASAREALSFKEGVHYIIDNVKTLTERGYEDLPKVTIIDNDTGRKAEGSRWSRGLHEFIEIIHGIDPYLESYTAASLSNSFFNGYERLYGFTGTMGGETIRREVSDTYQLGSFDVPPRQPSKRIDYGLKVLTDGDQHYAAIYAVLEARVAAGEACLVLFNTIENSEKFSKFLLAKKMAHQVLNEQQQKHEDAVVATAGDHGSVTVATNVAGRGTDIPVRATNFHVICADLPKNDRVRDQGYGRTARQGKQGSCETLLCIDDPALLAVYPKEELLLVMDSLEDRQLEIAINDAIEQKTMRESHQRKNRNMIEAICNAKLKLFFARLNDINQNFDSEVLDLSLTKICDDYAGYAVEERLQLGKLWQPLIRYANALLKQKAVTSVNWPGFIKEFKTIFVKDLTQLWAKFFTDLEDHYDLPLDDARARIEEDYASLLPQLDAFNPSQVLSQILSLAQRSIFMDEIQPTLSAAPKATFFSAAVSFDPDEVIRKIILKYQTVEINMPSLEQVFYQAVAKGADEDVFQLLKTKVNINLIDPVTKKAPLHVAIDNGHETTVRLLLAVKANAGLDGDGVSAEDYFARSELEGMKVLSLKIRAQRKQTPEVDILIKYKSAGSPKVYELSLRKAAILGNDGDIFLLLRTNNHRLNIFINSQDDDSKKTALHLAIENGKVSAARLLIQMGAAMDIKDAADKTAADYLAESSIKEMKSLALSCATAEHILDKYKTTRVSMPTIDEVLHKIAAAGDDPSLMSLLEFSDVDIDSQDVDKKTSLHYAAQNGRDTTVQILICAGARTDLKDSAGKVPADYLTKSIVKEIISIFEKPKTGLLM